MILYPYDVAYDVPDTIYDVLYSRARIENVFPQWSTVGLAEGNVQKLERAAIISDLGTEYLGSNPTLATSNDGWVGESRLGWVAECPMPPEDIATVTLSVNSSDISVKLCRTENEFQVSLNPCCIWFESALYFKNLARACLTSTCTGSVDLTSLDPYLEDLAIYGTSNGWEFLSIPDLTTLSYTPPATGDFKLSVISKNLVSALLTATVAINSGPPGQLSSFQFWTSLDEVGLFQKLPRFEDEENYDYRTRLVLHSAYPGTVDLKGLSFGVSHYLGACESVTVPTTGITWGSGAGPTELLFGYLTQTQIERFLTDPVSGGWATNYLDLGLLYLVDSNQVFLSTAVSGIVSGAAAGIKNPEAWLTWTPFTEVRSGRLLTQFTPSLNFSDKEISAAGVFGVQSHRLHGNDFVTPSGGPTDDLFDITEMVARQVGVTYGFTIWARTVFAASFEVTPEVDYLPEIVE